MSVDTSRSDQPPVGGRHPDRPEHHHEHHHNHRHHHEHHHSVSPRSNQRHPAATSTTITNTADATSPQSNAQRRPIPRYVRISRTCYTWITYRSRFSPLYPLHKHTASFHTTTNPLVHFPTHMTSYVFGSLQTSGRLWMRKAGDFWWIRCIREYTRTREYVQIFRSYIIQREITIHHNCRMRMIRRPASIMFLREKERWSRFPIC